MVNRNGDGYASGLQTGLTEAPVAAQDAQPDALPSASVCARMAIAANSVRLPVDSLVRVLVAVRLAVRDERPTAAVLTGLHWPSRHIEPLFRCSKQMKKPARFFTLRACNHMVRAVTCFARPQLLR